MVKKIHVKTILNKTKRRDPWFLDDYTLNPFSACSFNCLYCYIRGSKYGPDMQQAVQVKSNAPQLLNKALSQRAAKNQYGVVVMSSATDPYLKIEKDLQLTRNLLQTLEFYRFPVHVITKSPLVLRDTDVLGRIKQNSILPPELKGRVPSAFISFSFSTLHDPTAKIFEPGAPKPSARLEAIAALKDLGFTVGISFMPLLPYISDVEDQLMAAYRIFADLNVDYVLPAGLSLFGSGKADSKTLVLSAIKKHYPELVTHYQKLFKTNRLPIQYQKELNQKLKSLNQQFNIPNRILDLD